jgi:Flp pilus assembly protein TadG
MAGTLFLMIMGIFDLGRAVAVYISIAEAAHEGARQLVLRSNETSAPPDTLIVNATLAKIGGGGIVLMEDPCLPGCSTPAQASTNPPANSGYIWITPNRTPGNNLVTVQITYAYSPMTAMISQLTGTTITMKASSSMRAEY